MNADGANFDESPIGLRVRFLISGGNSARQPTNFATFVGIFPPSHKRWRR